MDMNVHPTLRYPQQRKVKLQRWPEQRAGGKKNSQDKHVYEYVLQIRVFFMYQNVTLPVQDTS